MRIVDALLTVNQFSRPGKPLDRVMAVVVHNLGIPGQRAMVARNYWENLKSQDAMDAIADRSASAHEIVDLDGTVYRTVPEDEKAYHCGASSYTKTAQAFFGDYCINPNSSPNRVAIGIEMAHLVEGRLNDITLASTRERIRYYCMRYSLDPFRQVFLHFDITGKDCPRWFVTHPDEWRAFIESL